MASQGITEPLCGVLSRFATRALAAAALAIGFGAVGATSPTSLASPATTGRIEGVVRLVAPDDKPIVSGAYPTRRVNKPVVRGAEIRNVIVFLRDVPGATSLPAARLEMVQQEEAFVPRVLAITRGSSVDFPNADPFFHNVFSLSRSATFDLGRFPRGERRTRTFTQPGLIKVYCHLHSHMSASIMVFDHPHFTVPSQEGGTFALNDVPAGEHRISAWHERIGESAKQIVVEAGRTVRIEFALPVEGR
jgi:plastocyanin